VTDPESTRPKSAEPAPTLVDVPESQRYELRVGDEVVAFAEYILVPGVNRIVLTHTEVDAQREGQGLGGTILEAMLDDVRRRGLLVQPLCPFAAAHIARHPEHADLVVPEMRAQLARG
jgi:predicted GNAT family acetyltransferase